MRGWIVRLLVPCLVLAITALVVADTAPLPERDGRQVHVRTVAELEQAVRHAEAGDEIIVAEGRYELEGTLAFADVEHVTLRGETGDPADVVLDGGGWGDPDDTYRDIGQRMINIQRSHDIVIADLSFVDGSQYGITVEPYPDPPHPSEIHIYNCRFRDIAIRAIKGTASSDGEHVKGGSIRGCTFEYTRRPDPDWEWALFNGNYVSAIDMMFLDGWTIADNVFRNVQGATGGGRGAIFLWNQSRNLTVERNILIHCDRGIAFGNPSEPTGYQEGTLHVYDSTIRNNFVVVRPGPGNTKGIELCWVQDVQVLHNTVFSADEQRYAIHFFQRIHDLHVANNLVRGRLTGDIEGATVEGNVRDAEAAFFVDVAAGDLRLRAEGYEAVGTGVPLPEVSEDFDAKPRGEPPVVGAHEGRAD